MMLKIIFCKFIILVTGFAWAMDAGGNIAPYYDYYLTGQNQDTINILAKNINIINEILLELAPSSTDIKYVNKISEKTISGNDWIVFKNYEIELKSSIPIIAPSQLWERLNCDIIVTEISDNHVKLTIVPQKFPIFGEPIEGDLTWSATVWLEAHPTKKSEKIIKDVNGQHDICRQNLEAEKKNLERLLEFLKKASVSTRSFS